MRLTSVMELQAGGPGSGRHPENVLEDHGWQKAKDTNSGGIYQHPSIPVKVAVDTRVGDWRTRDDEGTGGASLHQYLSKVENQHASLAAGGPGSGRKGLNKWKDEKTERKNARKDPKQKSFFGPKHEKELQNIKATIVKQGSQHCVKSHTGKNLGCSPTEGGAKKRLAQVEYFKHVKSASEGAEPPQTGVYGHSRGSDRKFTEGPKSLKGLKSNGAMYIDPITTFHPPSLKNAKRVPTDDPRETDDSLLDVTKRKEATEQRMKLLKTQIPGGNPPRIPIRTTMIAPHTAGSLPGVAASRRRRHGGMFRGYGAAKI
jgi:hypothetical protein